MRAWKRASKFRRAVSISLGTATIASLGTGLWGMFTQHGTIAVLAFFGAILAVMLVVYTLPTE